MVSDIQARDDTPRSDAWIEDAPGAPGVLSRVVESLRPFVKRVANRKLDRDLRAEASVSDLVQETLLVANRSFEKFQGRSEKEFKSWLVGIFQKKLSVFRRRQFRGREHGRAVEPVDQTRFARSDMTSPSGQAIRRERQELVREARARLPERSRVIVAWYIDEGCTFEEIGQRLGCSRVNARKLWERALKRLARELSTLRDESNVWNRSRDQTTAPDVERTDEE